LTRWAWPVVLGLLFALQLATHVLRQLDRTLRGPRADEVRALQPSVPDGILALDLTTAARTAGGSPELKVPLPASWISGPADRPRPPASLLVFVDGRPVHHVLGDPGLESGEPQAFYNAPRTRSLIIRCPGTEACREAIVARKTPLFTLALARSRLGRFPGHVVLFLTGLGLWIAVARQAAQRWLATRPLFILGATAVALAAWLACERYAPAWSAPLLILETLALGAAALSGLGHDAHVAARRIWADAASLDTGLRNRLARVLVVGLACGLVALPYVLTGLSWYPGDLDDSLTYLYGASRMLSSGSLVRGILDPSSWTYSIYPLGLAVVSWATNLHPMVAYRWLGYAGAALLPAAMGVFVYTVRRDLRTCLLACGVAGLWGGLAGYLWLASVGLPSLLRLQAPPLIWDDYFEPRFLGEYTGPHSELTSYLCRVPFYPREAGLVLFWPALGLIYAGLPRPHLRRIALFALLTMFCAAIYPYYGISGLIVLTVLTALEFRPGSPGGTRRWVLAGILLTAGLGVLGIAFVVVPLYKWPGGLVDYVAIVWRSAPASFPDRPSIEFSVRRILGGHFFMLLTLWLAVQFGARERLRDWPGHPLFLTGLGLSVLAGVLSVWTATGRVTLYPYGWIVPWRSLVEPVLVLGTAVALTRILDHLRGRRAYAAAAVLLLVPCLSPLHWTVNADLFLRRAALLPYGRGVNRQRYEEYAHRGAQLLGKVRLREPVLVQSPLTHFVAAALGVRTIAAASHGAELFLPAYQGRLLEAMARGDVGDVAALRQDEFARRLVATGSVVPVTTIGPYTVLRLSPSASGPRAGAATP
jgi:hypothetical protein